MANQAIDWGEVEDIARSAEQSGGTVGVAIIAPSGERFSYNGDRKFGAASTMKIPLMINIFKQIEQGQRALNDPYILRNEDRAVGSGVMLHLHEGIGLTLNDLLYLMISISDNSATNILLDYAGMEQLTELMHEMGMTNSNVSRKMQGKPAEGAQQENWATPNDYAMIVQKLLSGDEQVGSAESRGAMIALLEKQQNTKRISRYLPEGANIRWGSKTGSVKGVTNDVGFITTDKGTVIISVFCENLPDQHVGEQVIGDISRAAMKATGVVEPLRTS